MSQNNRRRRRENDTFAPTTQNIRDSVRKYLTGNPDNLPPIGEWDTSNVTDMGRLFYTNDPAHIWLTNFNEDISRWNVSNVTDMAEMFCNVAEFNQPLNDWDVSNVTDMEGMFWGATSFNQPLDNWDVSNVEDMELMFSGATSFNQPLNNWNVSNVIRMFEMFSGAISFNQPLDNWDVSNIEYLSGMFSGAENFNQDLTSWNIGHGASISNMFLNTRMNERNYPPVFEQRRALFAQRQAQRRLQEPRRTGVQVDAMQIHRAFAKINVPKLIEVLNINNVVTNMPAINEFPNFIKNELNSIVSAAFPNNPTATQNINNIVTRMNSIPINQFNEDFRKAIFLALSYVKNHFPITAQQEYLTAFIDNCANAYEGSDRMTCPAGGLERIVKTLEVGCVAAEATDPGLLPECTNIIKILNRDPRKQIPEMILDWYREHKQGTPNAFPETMSVEEKKANLRQFLLAEFPEETAFIDQQINEFANNVGFEPDDFTYGGAKRTRRNRRNRRNKRTKRRRTRKLNKKRKQ